MKSVYVRVAALLLCGFYFSSPTTTFAQVPCGNIIAPADWVDVFSTIETTPIVYCSDPFGVTPDITSPYTLSIDGKAIGQSETIVVSEGGTQNFAITGNPILTSVNHLIFLHDGNDYRFINTLPSVPQEADYRAFAESFFPIGTDIEPYMNAILANDPFSLEDDTMRNQLYSFLDYVDQNYVPQLPFLRAGTYTLVSKEFLLILTQENFFQKIFSSVIPTAYAAYGVNIFTLTFTIVETPPAPEGVSNILFLPGIQASRLYTQGVDGEEKLWEPGSNNDVEHLSMSETGVSNEAIYTKDVVEEISVIGSNIYKGFLAYLDTVNGELPPPMVRAFAYDWRYDVFDIVKDGTKYDDGLSKNPTETANYLATLSPTHKVTIIAHSNGGLLAKAIMMKLEEEGRADIVDKIIFIATPQIGTPKALATILHGYDQGKAWGLIEKEEVARTVMQNMPGVYGLLPSEMYLTTSWVPLITFDDSSTTKMFRDKYGFAISNTNEYSSFLKGEEGRADAGNDINEPSKANGTMLDTAFQNHREMLDGWTAPEGVEVYEIVGTGLKTPKSIEYKEFAMEYCNEMGVCTTSTKLEPVLHFTNYGDETVVSKSASNMEINDEYFFNLLLANKGITNQNNSHADITEAPEIQKLVDYILHGSSTEEVEFVSDTEPTFSDNTDIYTIHSPAHMYVQDVAGNITGKTGVGNDWLSGIPGSSYFEVGSVKYLLVPSDISYEIVIQGEVDGVYTHTLTQLSGDDTETIHHSFVATATPTMTARYEKTNGNFSNVSVDANGDGTDDIQMALDGKIIEEEVDYSDLISAVESLSVKKAEKKLLLIQANLAKALYEKRPKLARGVLDAMKVTLKLYIKKHIISEQEGKNIINIIDKIIQND